MEKLQLDEIFIIPVRADDADIAAICGGTFALADGILDNRRHTSNVKDYLKMVCRKYKGEKFYENKPVVIDENLITASGIAPFEFTFEVIKKINIMENIILKAWYIYTIQKNQNIFLN